MAGSIQKSGKGSWKLTVSMGFDGDGKRIRKTKTVRGNKREAEKELAKFVTEIESGQSADSGKTSFKDFAERWLRDYARKELSPKTVDRYEEILTARIYQHIGGKRLDQIRPTHLIDFYNYLQIEAPRLDGKPGHLSERTIQQHHRIISSILQAAVHWQLIPSNPASRVKPPKAEKREADFFDDEEVALLISALNEEPIKYKVAITLALFSGVRRGELMGFEWKDLDVQAGTIRVQRSSQYIEGKGIYTKAPKNEHSYRTITLPAFVIKLLGEYKAHWNEERLRVGDLWQGSDRLFTTWDGRPMHPDSLSSWFRKFLKKHNLPLFAFHALRHSAASLMINGGLELSLVSKRLGHADIGTTSNIYGHLFKSADSRAAETLNGFYEKVTARE